MHKQNTPKKHDEARVEALNALIAIWRQEALLTQSLFNSDPASNARAMRLTRETLKVEDALAAHIRLHAPKNPKLPVRALLHLASYEFFMASEKDYAVVNSYVNLAKSRNDTRKSAGFVNAILRKICNDELYLSDINSLGQELHNHLSKQYSTERLADISAGQLQPIETDLRIKSGDIALWAEKLGGQAIPQHQCVRINNYSQISKLEGYTDGEWWVQDIGATIAVDCFLDVKGKRVLDLCAAPGGKTMQLAAKGAIVTSVELSEKRAERIAENLSRTRLKADLIITDALDFKDEPFDAILLDAPCSATGTLRKHPDLKHDQPLQRLESLAPLQAKILAHAFSLLKPEGELIYVTCSMLQEEGEMQIDQFLKQETTARVIPLDPSEFALDSDFKPYIRSFPTAHEDAFNMDGFFIAKLTKTQN